MSYLQLNECHKKEKYTLGAFGSYQELIKESKVEPKKRYVYEYEPTSTYTTMTDNLHDNSQITCLCHNQSNLKHY